ncbi:glycosyltransferase [Polaribacter pectinis]|uniref:Glycosyltransferase n=1 Tax=Polaribacter pectinis TaxID=2738844 RepID=A0A7G9LCC4_9FLAO|nr:glycosyltransferase [Polaribacter pectinis]QNM86273.1 glycosyltransferase [Polaribacter pectinis]
MNKLGVIQIIDSLNTGGAEVLAINIANSLSNEKGVNSHICVSRKEGELLNNINKEVGYLFLNRKKVIDLKALFALKKYIKANKISVLHAHATSFFLAFCVKVIAPNIQVIWHNHFGNNINLKGKKLQVLKIASLFFRSIIVVNEDLKKWSIKSLFTKNVYYLKNFPVFVNKETITKLKGVKDKRIVHLAAFRQEKNHPFLIEAFQQFIKLNKDWSLHLVGKINKDVYSENIIRLIKNKGLEKHIFVYDSCLDVANILNQSTIGVLSSKFEGLPIALLEYGLAKLPVVVTNVGECSIVVKDNESGIVVESENITQLSEAFNLLANSKEKRDYFKNQHNNNVVETYSKEKFIRQLVKIYTA